MDATKEEWDKLPKYDVIKKKLKCFATYGCCHPCLNIKKSKQADCIFIIIIKTAFYARGKMIL